VDIYLLNFSICQALAKTLTVAQLAYLRDQFTLLGPNKSGLISMQNFKTVSTYLKLKFIVPFPNFFEALTVILAGCFEELHRCFKGFKGLRLREYGKFEGLSVIPN